MLGDGGGRAVVVIEEVDDLLLSVGLGGLSVDSTRDLGGFGLSGSLPGVRLKRGVLDNLLSRLAVSRNTFLISRDESLGSSSFLQIIISLNSLKMLKNGNWITAIRSRLRVRQ